MRLWHWKLIEGLPKQQLVAQWRELSAIATNIRVKGTPNHILVNKIMNYSFDHFISYAHYVRSEMTRRGYKTMDKVWDNICSVCDGEYNILPKEELFVGWHNTRYAVQCLTNLQEKYDCGGITHKEWETLGNVVMRAEYQRALKEELDRRGIFYECNYR